MFDINNSLLYYGINLKMEKEKKQMYGRVNYEEKNKGIRLLTKYWVKF